MSTDEVKAKTKMEGYYPGPGSQHRSDTETTLNTDTSSESGGSSMPVEDVEGFDDLCDEFKSGEIDAVESGSDYDNEPPLDDRQDFERFIEAHDSLQTSQAQSPKCASLISFQAQAVVSLPFRRIPSLLCPLLKKSNIEVSRWRTKFFATAPPPKRSFSNTFATWLSFM